MIYSLNFSNIKKQLLLLCVFCLCLTSSAQGFGEKELLNNRWSFHLGDLQYGGREYMDCSRWPVVDLPHDWSVKQAARPDLASCTGYLPGGIAWYRKNITIPKEKEGQQVYIYFEGVYNNSEVFINGKWIGKRPNGYISFLYDLTPYIKWGEENALAVRVNHGDDADSRWYTGSGIYRDVYLVYANPLHIDLWGVSYQTQSTAQTATIDINTRLNNRLEKCSVKVVHELYDAQGKKVASSEKKSQVEAFTLTDIPQKMSLSSPQLWDLESPYLYTLKTFVYRGNDLLDQSSFRLGIRRIDFNAQTGFSLNGTQMKMKGVCIHHDAGVLGAAATKSVWYTRLSSLKSLGVNAIRTSHNPQAPFLYDLCDELGFLVIDEAFDEWEYPKNKWIDGWNKGTPGHQGSSQYFREWSSRDLNDMVKRDRNHPSIVLWSIGNEVDYPNDPYSHPILAKEGIGQEHIRAFLEDHPRAERLGDIAKELVAAVKEADRTRPVTAALAGAVMSNYTDYPFVLDVVGYNYTENKYESDHQLYPERILYGSENRHDMPAWYAVKNHDFIFGQFLWTGLDYLGESGAWPSRGFTTGLLDLAGNIKPLGYFRKALWSEQPMVYLGSTPNYSRRQEENRWSNNAPHLWNYENDRSVSVVCYTNCEEAELLLNGQPFAPRKKYDPQTGIIGWNVPFTPGILKVIAYRQGKPLACDSIVTNTMAAEIQAEALPTYGSDKVRQLCVQILDTNGRPSILADNEITCRISNGILLGMENASPYASDNFQDNRQRCINGKMTIYALQMSPDKPMIVRLSSPLLKSVVVEME